MKKEPYILAISGGLSVSYIATLVAWQRDWNITWLIVAAITFVIALLVIFILTYQMWSRIQDKHARMTPVESIVLNFIPLFNFYWLFQCIWGFAKDCNVYMHKHGIKSPKLPTQVYFWYVVMWFLSPIPYVGLVSVPLALVLVTIIITKTIDALNAIDAKKK